MSQIAKLDRPLRRRMGRMVIEIGPAGVRLRAFGRRTWHQVTWEQIAALDDASEPQETLSRALDRRLGRERLAELRIVTHGKGGPADALAAE